MNFETWLVIRRDNGTQLGKHVLHRTVKAGWLRERLGQWSGPVCLYNTTTGEVFY